MQAIGYAVPCRQSVREAVDPIFFEQPLLKPYVFFDVSHGREQRGGAGGGSLRNQVSVVNSSFGRSACGVE